MKLPMRFHCGAIFASWILLPHIVLGQTCYYPNGDISTSDYPCSSDVEGLCCPLNWQCLSNGLCYLENEQYYGRYTCTDQTWQSSGCPQLCTDGNTDSGDQAVLQCSSQGGNWCCDHNRNKTNPCCDNSDIDFFPIAEGSSVASISTTGPAAASVIINGVLPDSAGQDTTSSETTSTPSSTSTTPTLASASTSTSSTKTAGSGAATQSPTSLVSVISIISVVTSVGGGLATVTSAVIHTASPTVVPASSSSHHGAEIGGGVAGGVALIALISLAFFLLYRRKKRQQYQSAPTTEYRNSMDYMYKSNDMGSPKTAETSPEIDGTPIVGVYRGWGPTGGEGALRVVNGSNRQSTVSGTGTNARDSLMSELESSTTPVRAALRSPQPAIAEQPYELAGEGEK